MNGTGFGCLEEMNRAGCGPRMERYDASRVSDTEASEPTTRAGVGWMVNGKWIGPTWCGEYRSSSDGEMEMKSILAGEYDCVNVTLRQVAVSGNFTTIWFCAALLSVLVRCRMRVRTGDTVRHGHMILRWAWLRRAPPPETPL